MMNKLICPVCKNFNILGTPHCQRCGVSLTGSDAISTQPQISPQATITCPYCAEQIQASAVKCRFCGEWLQEKPVEVRQLEGDERNGCMELGGCLFPLIGFIMWAALVGRYPEKAKHIGIYSFFGLCIGLIGWFIIVISS